MEHRFNAVQTLYIWLIPIGTAAWSHQLWCLHEAPYTQYLTLCVCVCPMYSVFLCVIGLWHLGVKPSIPMTKALAGRYGRCCLTIIKQASCFKWNVNTHARVWVVSAHTHTHTLRRVCSLFVALFCVFLARPGGEFPRVKTTAWRTSSSTRT